MIDWVAVRPAHQQILLTALGRGWQGGVIAMALVPTAPLSLVAWSEGARARRAARWPDVLVEWAEIYEERLFASDLGPVLAEEVSALGADALAVHADPGFARAGVGWYAKGALAAYEHVGAARVAWSPDGGLGRPVDSSVGSMFATRGRLGGALAEEAGGETILARAFLRLLDAPPPPMDELAGLVARAPVQRLRLP
jgi:hypothetical protein